MHSSNPLYYAFSITLLLTIAEYANINGLFMYTNASYLQFAYNTLNILSILFCIIS